MLQPGYEEYTAVKIFLDDEKLMPCEVLDSDSPYYLRLKVAILPEKKGEPDYGEILLPHGAVLLIMIDTPEKVLGFAQPRQP